MEATTTLVILSVLGLVMFKMALNILAPRQWTLQQSLTDAYMGYEKAFAQRIPFADLKGDDSPWPAFPAKSEVNVEIGKLPGGGPIDARVIRTRRPDPNNFPVFGGTTGTAETNPAGMEVWRVQSLVEYEVGGRTYVKSRTVIRSQ